MMAIAENRHFSYDNEIELLWFIASEMKKEALDEESLDTHTQSILEEELKIIKERIKVEEFTGY